GSARLRATRRRPRPARRPDPARPRTDPRRLHGSGTPASRTSPHRPPRLLLRELLHLVPGLAHAGREHREEPRRLRPDVERRVDDACRNDDGVAGPDQPALVLDPLLELSGA